MRSFRHRRGRILFEVFGSALIASGSAAGWVSLGGISLLVPAVVVTLYGLFRAVMLFARDPALCFDQRGIQVGRLFRTSTYRWDQVREVRAGHWRLDEGMPIRLPSWFPAEREYLEFMVPAGPLDFGWLKLRTDMIQMPAGGVHELVEMIRSAQVAAIGGRRAAMTRLGLDPNEQVAAAKVTGVQAERWQRLGLATDNAELVPKPAELEPAPQMAMPPRPSFGRRVR